MCNFKSGLVLKDRVFVPDYDNHSQMITELGINDNSPFEPTFVKIEIIPTNNDPFSDIDSWAFIVDQDRLPEWYVAEVDEPRAREAVKAWAKDHIFINAPGLVLESGKGYYLKDCPNVVLKGSSRVEYMVGSSSVGRMEDSSRVEYMVGSSSVERMVGSSRVEYMVGSSSVGRMEDSSSVGRMEDSSSVERMVGSSRVEYMVGSSSVGRMEDSSRVEYMEDSSSVGRMEDSSQITIAQYWSDGVKQDNIILCNNAIIKDERTKTIYQSGDWKLVTVASKEI